MTPSPEAEAIAKQIIGTMAVRDFAEIVDEALAPHRERVRRLVEAVPALIALTEGLNAELDRLVGVVEYPMRDEIAEARAALAPFLEQETTP